MAKRTAATTAPQGGAGTDDEDEDDTPAPRRRSASPYRDEDGPSDNSIRRHMGEHVRNDRALQIMQSDNAKYRRRNAELKGQLEELQGKAPKDGAVVLEGDDAKAWTAIKALGKSADDLKKIVDEHGVLTTEKTNAAAAKVNATAASKAGFKNGDVFADLVESKGLAVEIRSVQVEGKNVEVPYIRAKTADAATAVPAKEYVEKHLGGYMAALMAAPAGSSAATSAASAAGGSQTVHSTPAFDMTASSSGDMAPASAGLLAKIGGGKYQTPSEMRKAAAGK